MTYLATVLADTPRNLWQLAEAGGAGTAVDTIAAFNGTNTGVTTGVAGYVDGQTAYQFPGGAGNSVLASGALPANGVPFTIEGWFNPAAVATNQVCILFGAVNGYGIGILSNGHWGLIIAGYSVFDTGVAAVAAGWHHVALVGINGGSSAVPFNLYIDGVYVYTAFGMFGTNTATNEFWIGDWNAGFGADWPFDGDAQFVALYTYQLTATQIHAHYIAGLQPGGNDRTNQFRVQDVEVSEQGTMNVDRLRVTVAGEMLSSTVRADRFRLTMVVKTRDLTPGTALRHYRLRR